MSKSFAIALVLALLIGQGSALATTYYVSPTGRDSNPGTSTTTPFATIAHAASLTLPGDTVDVMTGTYGAFIISRPGSASGGYITYQPAPGQHPTIQATPALGNGILVNSTSYITIWGFNVVGQAATTTLAQAKADPNAMQINCIGVSTTSHHVKIVGNIVSYCPQAGIMYLGDYGWIYQNDVHHNAFWSNKEGSGIDVENHPFDASTGSKMYVYNNVAYSNQNYVCVNVAVGQCQITDGNGIIIDSELSSGYTGRVNVYNNISINNGCSGIRVYNSNTVDIYNNTTFENNVSGTMPAPYTGCTFGGEITVHKTSGLKVLNNIIWGSAGVPQNCSWCVSTNLTWDYNIVWGGLGAQAIGPHDILANPEFIGDGTFRLAIGSPAIGTGTPTLVPTIDYAGHPRRSGSVDRGAYTAY